MAGGWASAPSDDGGGPLLPGLDMGAEAADSGFVGRRFAKPDPFRRRRRRRVPLLCRGAVAGPPPATPMASTAAGDAAELMSTDGAGLTTNAGTETTNGSDAAGGAGVSPLGSPRGDMGSSHTSSVPPSPTRMGHYTGPSVLEPEWETDENETCVHVGPDGQPLVQRGSGLSGSDSESGSSRGRDGRRAPLPIHSNGALGDSGESTSSGLEEGPLGSRPLRGRRRRHRHPPHRTAAPRPAAGAPTAEAGWGIADWAPGPLRALTDEPDPVLAALDDGMGSRFTPRLPQSVNGPAPHAHP